MSAAKKKPISQVYPSRTGNDAQTALRLVKIQAEQLKEKLQKSVIDNPQTAKKAALLISLWIDRGNKKSKNSR